MMKARISRVRHFAAWGEVMSMRASRSIAVFLFVLAFAGAASDVYAQPQQVKVTRDRAIIWRRGERLPITTVREGTVLEVVDREDDWYVVRVPAEYGGNGEVGLIAISQVEPADGSPAEEPGVPAFPDRPEPRRVRRPVPKARPLEIFGIGQVGYHAFLARDTFKAVFDNGGAAPGFGGGARIHVQGLAFVDVSVDRFSMTGERVFAADGDFVRLGIRDRVRIVPVAVNAGYRRQGHYASPYVGGGIGRVFFRETSDFADAAEDVDERYTSYQVIAGVEFGAPRSALRTAFEFQFSTVPDAIGVGGASAAFNEHNLGGLQVRLRIMGGR
jgi:opacity protein-like surface antigen